MSPRVVEQVIQYHRKPALSESNRICQRAPSMSFAARHLSCGKAMCVARPGERGLSLLISPCLTATERSCRTLTLHGRTGRNRTQTGIGTERFSPVADSVPVSGWMRYTTTVSES